MCDRCDRLEAALRPFVGYRSGFVTHDGETVWIAHISARDHANAEAALACVPAQPDSGAVLSKWTALRECAITTIDGSTFRLVRTDEFDTLMSEIEQFGPGAALGGDAAVTAGDDERCGAPSTGPITSQPDSEQTVDVVRDVEAAMSQPDSEKADGQ